MTTFDYRRLALTAQRLLARFGAPATLRQQAAPIVGDDPWTPTPPAPSDTPIMAVLGNYNDIDRQGTLIQQGDRKIIFAAAGLPAEPAEGDQILLGERVFKTIDGKATVVLVARAFTIINLTKGEPGGTPLVYIAQARL